MIDQRFRAILPQYTQPLITCYQRLGLTPNHITLIGLLIAIVSAIFAANGWLITAMFTWWLGRIFDGTDGIYARATNQVSEIGGFYDIVSDMAAYSAMIIGLAVAFPQFSLEWQLILAGYVLCITSALSLGIIERSQPEIEQKDNRSFRLASGLAEAGETGIAYSLFLLLPQHLSWLLWAWITILTVTVISRCFLVRRL